MLFELGPSLAHSQRRCFSATVGGKPAIVELDNGAMFKLTDRSSDRRTAQVLDSKRLQIADAARQLIDRGHIVERDGRIEIFVTALDL